MSTLILDVCHCSIFTQGRRKAKDQNTYFFLGCCCGILIFGGILQVLNKCESDW